MVLHRPYQAFFRGHKLMQMRGPPLFTHLLKQMLSHHNYRRCSMAYLNVRHVSNIPKPI